MSLLTIRFGRCRGLPFFLWLAAFALQHPAQAAGGRTERADPLDAQARVPSVVHRPALAGYRRLGDDRPVAWKDANEAVNRIGGWRSYAREAQSPAPADPRGRQDLPVATPAPASSAPSGTAPAPRGHGQH